MANWSWGLEWWSGTVGELWEKREHINSCLSVSGREASCVKVLSLPAAEHEWIWGNIHEYSIELLSFSFNFLFSVPHPPPVFPDFLSAILIFCLLFLTLAFSVSVLHSCCAVSQDVKVFPTSSPGSPLNLTHCNNFRNTRQHHRAPAVKHLSDSSVLSSLCFIYNLFKSIIMDLVSLYQ